MCIYVYTHIHVYTHTSSHTLSLTHTCCAHRHTLILANISLTFINRPQGWPRTSRRAWFHGTPGWANPLTWWSYMHTYMVSVQAYMHTYTPMLYENVYPFIALCKYWPRDWPRDLRFLDFAVILQTSICCQLSEGHVIWRSCDLKVMWSEGHVIWSHVIWSHVIWRSCYSSVASLTSWSNSMPGKFQDSQTRLRA